MRNDFEAGALEANLLDAKTPKRKQSTLTGAPAKKSILNRRPSQKRTQLRELNSNKVVFISIMFVMVYSPFNGIQNFLQEIMKENGYENLGLFALGTFYIAFGLGSFFTPQYSTRNDYKFTFLISFLPMCLFFFSLWLSIWCVPHTEYGFCEPVAISFIALGCSILAGVGTSLLWITKSIYFTDCSNPFNKGRMFGIFSSIAPWTHIIGTVFIGLILHDFGSKKLLLAIIFLCLVASIMALGVKRPDKDSGDFQLMIELNALTGDLGGADGEDKTQNRSDVIIPRMEYFTRQFFWKCLKTQKMMIFYPLFITSALNFSLFVTYLSSDVFTVLKEEEENPEAHFSQEIGKIAWVFFALGLGEILADRFFSAKVNTNKEAALSLVYKVFILCAILHLIQHSVRWYSLYLPLAFLYGVGDAGSQEVIGGLISMKFFERFEPFTCFRIVYFTSLGFFFILNMALAQGAPVFSFILFIVLIIFAWLNNYRFFTIQS